MTILFIFSGRIYGFSHDNDQIILVFYEKWVITFKIKISGKFYISV